MADRFDREERSRIMSKVRGKDTGPEIKVRKALHSMGYRFRLHRRDLPGVPDIVLPKYKTVIFVNGCFWHGCPTCRRASVRPKTNAEYWNRKLDRNKQRDQEHYREAERLGWRVIVVWECETKDRDLPRLRERLKNELSAIGPARPDDALSRPSRLSRLSRAEDAEAFPARTFQDPKDPEIRSN